MANKEEKHKENIPGPWYCTDPDDSEGEGCIACGLCYGSAPEFFAEDDDGNAYICAQPQSEDEIALCQEQLEDCPVSSIGSDG
ncbi:MAG: ferredoxin [Lentisphaerales bacterium]|nr:ferredoxin [Lentisphaerales bacterium]